MLTPIIAQAQEGRDVPDAKILFRLNSAVVDSSYADNAQTIEKLDKVLGSDQSYKIQRIDVVSSSSIDGNYDLNKNLSQKRINAVQSFLAKRYPSVPQSIFSYVVLGENWKDLRACVVADPNVPHRDRVLAVIDNSSTYDRKEAEFKNIYEGASWEYLKDNIFPQQRYGVGMMVVLKEEYRNQEPTTAPKTVVEEKIRTQSEMSNGGDDKALIALKTNLLADALTAINLELEVPIGNRYSVAAEMKFPWWRGEKSDFTMQILSGHIEGKYWFGERTKENRLLGFSAGVFTGFGTYDIQPFRSTGVAGDFFELGFLVGYSHSIYKNLNLEYEMGLGYIHSGYRSYEMTNIDGVGYVKEAKAECTDGKIYKNTFLPTRFKVSLVWNIGVPAYWR